MSKEELINEDDFIDETTIVPRRNGHMNQNDLGVDFQSKNKKPGGDEEASSSSGNTAPPKKLKYPKSIFFIFSNEFCERYSYYGMRTILSLYLVSQSGLEYDETTATIIYHTFVMLCYFTPLIGGIIADSWLGKYKTIFYVSIIYALGNISLAIGAFPQVAIPHRVLALLGLILIGAGTGGIKPCVSSFGGDQFVIPEQQKQLDSYFSVFYFSINAGSVLSCFFTPMMREVKCLGQDTCYPLAFGVPAVLMILSIFFFVIGKRMYKMKEPEGTNIAIEVTKCIGHAISKKITSNEKKSHWLEYAEDKYSRKLIEETKILLGICLLFAPTIVFWSLYEQQGSKWTFQANRMDGRFGSYILLPDQMQTLNAVLCLIFIPLFEYIIYPIAYKLHLIRTSLQKISWGGFLAAVSFVLSGLLQFYVNTSNPVFPEPGHSQLRIFNDLNCTINIQPGGFPTNDDPLKTTSGPIVIEPFKDYLDLTIPNNNTKHMHAQLTSNCAFKNNTGIVELNVEKASSYVVLFNSSGFLELHPLNTTGYDELDKTINGNPKLKLIYNINKPVNVKFSISSETHIYNLEPTIDGNESHQTIWNTTMTTGIYDVYVDNVVLDKKANLEPGAVYIFMLVNTTEKWNFELFTLTPANNISILWQSPQYVVITAAEILLSITGMEFSYNQSPDSMKSFVSSLWLVTDSFGNIIVLIIEGVDIFTNQAYTYFLFAGLMVVVMIIFVILAVNYKEPEFEVDENNRVVIKGLATPKEELQTT